MSTGKLITRTTTALALLLMVCSAGCGKSTSGSAVVRIGDVSIDRTTVAHWEEAIKAGAIATIDSHSSRQSTREQALELLISAHWLTGEAAREGVTISRDAVRKLANEPLTALAKATGQRAKALASPDTEFLAEAALAARGIRKAVSSRIPAVTEAELTDYYTRHHRVLFREETRTTDLIEQLNNRSSAAALGKRLGIGKQFASRALHETVNQQTPGEEERNFDGELVRAIFAAPLHVVGGPVRYAGHWVIFVVRQANRGPYVLPTDVTAAESALNVAHQQVALKAFSAKYQREWKTRTICSTRFVIANCSESHEQLPPQATPFGGV
ncbi:MAG TPA: peptidylprolyl isomerase [Solirubrobacteraceae bacterium]|jgi:hypothetical protein|nr:peptidylprolyl isomerase [Solirubrobacteraceae bacterium]